MSQNKSATCITPKVDKHTLTVKDDSLIFCSTVSRAEKPSSRNVKSISVGVLVFMVTSTFDWLQVNCKGEEGHIEITFSFENIALGVLEVHFIHC